MPKNICPKLEWKHFSDLDATKRSILLLLYWLDANPSANIEFFSTNYNWLYIAAESSQFVQQGFSRKLVPASWEHANEALNPPLWVKDHRSKADEINNSKCQDQAADQDGEAEQTCLASSRRPVRSPQRWVRPRNSSSEPKIKQTHNNSNRRKVLQLQPAQDSRAAPTNKWLGRRHALRFLRQHSGLWFQGRAQLSWICWVF